MSGADLASPLSRWVKAGHSGTHKVCVVLRSQAGTIGCGSSSNGTDPSVMLR